MPPGLLLLAALLGPFSGPATPRPAVYQHGETVAALAVSPDGRFVVSAGWDRTVRLWDAATEKEVRTFTGHAAEIECVAFAPDGRTVAAGGWDRTVRIWDAATGKELRRLGEHPDGVLALAFAPDGKSIASGNQDRMARGGTLHLWNAVEGSELRRFDGQALPVTGLCFAADGKTLASSSLDRAVRIWEVGTGKPLHRLDHPDAVFGIALSADGRLLASAGADKRVRLWDVAAEKELRVFEGHTDKVRAVAFAPDQRSVLSASLDRTVRLWETASGKQRHVWKGHTAGVRALALFPGGRAFASGSSDHTVRVELVLPPLELLEPWTPEQLDARWSALKEDDAVVAYRAMVELTAAPTQAIPFLRERLQKGPVVDAERVARLIKELDADQFEVRDQASRELAKLGRAVERDLKKVLEGAPSIEVRERIAALFEGFQGVGVHGEELRILRGVEVLEGLGTPEARRTLRLLAGGKASPPTAEAAEAALRRWAQLARWTPEK